MHRAIAPRAEALAPPQPRRPGSEELAYLVYESYARRSYTGWFLLSARGWRRPCTRPSIICLLEGRRDANLLVVRPRGLAQ